MSITNDNGGEGKVVDMKTATQLNQEAAIKVLERTLERARKGEIAAVAISYVLHDRVTISQAWSSCDCVAALIGAVGITHHQMISGAVVPASPIPRRGA